MKPRNKFEKAVLAQSKKLRPITKAQMKWAFRECIDHYANRLPKGRTTCMDCGHSWMMEEQAERCTCPKCGARLKVVTSYVRKVRQKQYFTVLTTCGEYQVLRMYLLFVEMEKGCKADPYALEIGQYWWDKDGRTAVVGKQRIMGRYLDLFSFASPMAIRRDNIAYDHISYSPLYPKFKVTDTLRRNGFKGDFHDIVPTTLIPALLSDSRAETLMKSGNDEHLRYFLTNPQALDRCWNSYKIAMRNKYDITDISLWCDLLCLLEKFGKDLRNPHFICPTDLKAAHDLYMGKRQAQLERERQQQRREWEAERLERERKRLEEMAEEKDEYIRKKSAFLNLVLTDGLIIVKVLQSVDEFYEEGKAMHHCVYTNAYYNKENALILSARIDGERIETVEVDLRTLKVVQSRGVCNSNTEYHDRIIALVESNAEQIRQRMIAA